MSALSLDDAALAALTFADLGVPAPMAGAMARRGITSPFPIQAATIPDALAGRDICGRAPTGSGKTIAFGIPLVVGVGKAKSRRPRGLVLVPTRELASQVCHELQQLAKPKGPWVEAFYGGVGFPKQVQALQRGVDIAVCCPGRLADLINQGCADLRDVDFVVVDEADRMADMGFLPEVRRILDQCSGDRQTLLFSATLDGDVDVLIKRYQHDPARHEFHRDDEDASRATHVFWNVERADRLRTAASVIARSGPTVVFCRTKRGADRVARQLETSGVTAAAIHGDRSQAQRERALRAFHKGEVLALVATDVAARGIHVDDVACVIHFDPPQEAKDYVHRSGRTARAGASGLVVTLVLPDLRKDVKRMQRELGYPVGFEAPAPEAIEQNPRAHSRPKRASHDRRNEPSTTAKRAKPGPSRTHRADDARRTPGAGSAKPTTPAASKGEKRKRPFDAVVDHGAPAKKKRTATAGADTPASGGARTPRPDLEPLPEGKRRPSGASRRKAKRLAALDVETGGDSRSTKNNRRPASGTPNGKRSSGKAKARKAGQGATARSGPSGASRPSSQRSSRGSGTTGSRRQGTAAGARRSGPSHSR